MFSFISHRFRKPRSILFILMVLFIFYVIANQFFLNLIAQNERIELNEVVNVREEAQYHMVSTKLFSFLSLEILD